MGEITFKDLYGTPAAGEIAASSAMALAATPWVGEHALARARLVALGSASIVAFFKTRRLETGPSTRSTTRIQVAGGALVAGRGVASVGARY